MYMLAKVIMVKQPDGIKSIFQSYIICHWSTIVDAMKQLILTEATDYILKLIIITKMLDIIG